MIALFEFVEPGQLSKNERQIFEMRHHLAKLVGGLPSKVKAIRVSQTMRADVLGGDDTLGL